MPIPERMYDVFICHASEDKVPFVRRLAGELRKANIETWYDEFSLKLGDSIRRSVDHGLSKSRFGVVVLSRAFFSKRWPQYELDALVEREMAGETRVLLPVWHKVKHAEVKRYSLALAGRKAISSERGLKRVVSEILGVVHPQGSPLVYARDTLLRWGMTPPVVTDQFWLDVVEASNRIPGYGSRIPQETAWSRWSFPLPEKDGGVQAHGERLAWTAMQLNWVKFADEIPISPLTPPEQVLKFIRRHPGLFETCCDFPEFLIEYAPQLTIPGMAGKLERIIEASYQESLAELHKNFKENSVWGSALTTTRKSPTCDGIWTLRHPRFGDYQCESVANEYFWGSGGLQVSPYDDTDHAIWLLSKASHWLPKRIHAYLLKGMTRRHTWPWGSYAPMNRGGKWSTNGALSEAMYKASEGKKQFKWNAAIKSDCLERIALAVKTIVLPEPPEYLFSKFLKARFVSGFIATDREMRLKRESKH